MGVSGCRPADLGIDVVCESATKYLNGHADVIAGVVAGSAEFMQRVSRACYSMPHASSHVFAHQPSCLSASRYSLSKKCCSPFGCKSHCANACKFVSKLAGKL